MGAEIGQGFAVDEEAWGAGDAEGFCVGGVAGDGRGDFCGHEDFPGLGFVEAGLDGGGPGGAGVGVVVPLRLGFEDGFQDLWVNALFAGGFQQADGLFGADVQGHVAQHQADVVRVFGHHLFDDGVEGAAAFAGWVEEFDHGHRGFGRAEAWRVEAHQGAAVLHRRGDLHRSGGAVVVERGGAEAEHRDGGDGDDEGTTTHGVTLRRTISRRMINRLKTPSDSNGNGRPLRMVMSAPAQDGPAPQGCRLSVIKPKYSRLWKNASSQPAPARGRP